MISVGLSLVFTNSVPLDVVSAQFVFISMELAIVKCIGLLSATSLFPKPTVCDPNMGHDNKCTFLYSAVQLPNIAKV